MRNMSNSVWIVWSVVTASLACVNQPTKEAAVGKRQSALTPSTAFEIVKKIPVGVSPQKVVLSSDGNTAYVSNYGANSVSVVDLASGTQVAVYPVGSLPLALALGPGGTTLYVGQNGGGVSAIHLASGAVTAIDTSGFPVRDLAIPPGGSRAYLAMEFGGLRAIELATGTVSTIPSVGGCPEGLAVTPDGSRLFVNYQCGGPGSSGGGHDAIGVFDAVTGAFITSIVGLANVGGGIATDGNLILAQGGDACIQPAYDHVGCPVLGAGITNVIDAVSLTPFAPLPNGNGFSFAPNQAFLLSGGDALQILDYQTRATVQTIPVAASGLVAFSADGKQFYAPVPGENVLAVVSVGSAQGAACGTGADCASTFCVDGVCCASAACGSCHSCNGPGIPGTCTLVPAGLPDPKGICGDQGAASCGTNGRCDGTGGCQKYASGTQCVPPSCPNGSSTKTLAKTCDGQGACANGGTTVSCGAFLCNGINDCLHNCRSTADCVTPNLCDLKNNLCGSRKPAGCMCMTTIECQTGLFCTGGVCCDSITSGTCAPLPAGSPGCGTSGTGGSSGTGGTSGTGASCVAAADCASGFCVDGVCCDSACGAGDPNDCQACSVTAGAATNGTCGPRPSGGVCGATPGICQTAGICGGGPTCSGPTTIPGCAPATIPSGCAGSCDPIELRGGLAVESGITVEFQGGASAGQISVNACDATSPPPTGYKVIDGMNGKYCWDLKVSASVSYTTPPPIIVCIHYPEAIAANENVFQMAHDDGSGVFAMNTTDRFPDDNIICGFAYSLSPFAIVLPLDLTGPVFSNAPGPITAFATSTSGAKVTYALPKAVDAVDGPRPVTCAPASGTIFPVGKTTVTCTAADKVGNKSTASFTVWVQYQAPTDGTFFLPPIRANGSSIFAIGRAVPVKFKLTGASAGITNLVAKLVVTKISSSILGTVTDVGDEDGEDTDFLFKFRAGAKTYGYRWKTLGQTQGTYQLRADLGDGVQHQINVSLRSAK